MTTSPFELPPKPARMPAPPTPPPVGPRPPAPRRSGWVVVLVVIVATIVVVAVSVAIAAIIVHDREANLGPAGEVNRGTTVTLDPAPTREERQLLGHMPFVVDVSGARVTWRENADCARVPLGAGAVASFECALTGFGADTVRYTLFESEPAMTRVYDEAVDAAGVDRYQGSCKAGAPAEGNWQSSFSDAVGNVLPDGRMLCTERAGEGSIVWTHDDLRVMSETSSPGAWKTLYRFWSSYAGLTV